MARRTLKEMSDLECIEAYQDNRKNGEGCAYISGYGSRCSYQTANAMINRGERIVNLMIRTASKIKAEAALNDFNHAYPVDTHTYPCYYPLVETGEADMTDLKPYISTAATQFAPGNFVTTWNPELGRVAVGVTRAIEDPQEANPRVLVKWLHDLSQEWVRSEYLYLAKA